MDLVMEILNLPFEQSKAEVRATLERGRNLFNLLLLSQKLLIHGRNTAFARLFKLGWMLMWKHEGWKRALRSPRSPTSEITQPHHTH